MTVDDAKFPKINMIIAMTESGLIGKKNGLPWQSAVDMAWFKRQTMGWPVIFGRKTAERMPTFPLKNRPCAVVSGKIMPVGTELVFPTLTTACLHFQNFEQIFIAGGASLYDGALRAIKPWFKEPLVDAIIKTKFPDGYAEGDVYLDKQTMSMMSEEFFSLSYHAALEYSPEYKMYYPPEKMPDRSVAGSLLVKNSDTLFPWIMFEIWNRKKTK